MQSMGKSWDYAIQVIGLSSSLNFSQEKKKSKKLRERNAHNKGMYFHERIDFH